VVDSQLYFGAWNGKLYSIDIRTAKLRWTFQAPADIKGSAALNGDMVVVGDYAGQVHGVSRATGHEVWRFTGGRRFYGGPAVADGKVVIGDVGGAVLALNAQDGNEIWRHSTGGQYVYSSPAVADGVVYIGSYNGAFQALDLETGAQRWSYDVGGRISGSATVVNGIVYTAVLAAPGQPKRTWGLDIRNGRVRYQGSDGRYSPAVGAGRTLYLVGSRRLYAYRAGAP
jgi:outer membrane protein assembly factor BamB